MKAYYQLKIYDKNHGLIRKTRKKLSKSFVLNFINFLYFLFSGGNGGTLYGLSMTEINGTTEYCYGASISIGVGGNKGFIDTLAALGHVSYTAMIPSPGIVVGTGTNAVTPTDYDLQTRIVDGTGAGQLEIFPSGTWAPSVNVGAGTASFVLEGMFRNTSGGTITINEVGVSGAGLTFQALYQHTYLLIRDLVSPGQAVADGEYLKVSYTLQITA